MSGRLKTGPLDLADEGLAQGLRLVHPALLDQGDPRDSDRLQRARMLVAERTRRDVAFAGLDLFGEPRWAMVLDLYIARLQGIDVPVTSACVASGAPVTTALRHIADMLVDGILLRESDQEDRRRTNLRLTEHTIATIERYLDEQRSNYRQ